MHIYADEVRGRVPLVGELGMARHGGWRRLLVLG